MYSANILIKCSCNTSFNVHEDNLKKKESITCPNCGKDLDKTQLDNLKDGISKLSLVKQLSTNQPQKDKPTPFKFSVTYDFAD